MTTAIILLILWTWGLTPLWVNILCTILLSAKFIVGLVISIIGALAKKAERDAEQSVIEIMKKLNR